MRRSAYVTPVTGLDLADVNRWVVMSSYSQKQHAARLVHERAGWLGNDWLQFGCGQLGLRQPSAMYAIGPEVMEGFEVCGQWFCQTVLRRGLSPDEQAELARQFNLSRERLAELEKVLSNG